MFLLQSNSVFFIGQKNCHLSGKFGTSLEFFWVQCNVKICLILLFFGKVLQNCWCHDTGKTKTPCHIEQAKYLNKTRKLEPALSFTSKISPNLNMKNMILIFTKVFFMGLMGQIRQIPSHHSLVIRPSRYPRISLF